MILSAGIFQATKPDLLFLKYILHWVCICIAVAESPSAYHQPLVRVLCSGDGTQTQEFFKASWEVRGPQIQIQTIFSSNFFIVLI